jgi:hypothetical protein
MYSKAQNSIGTMGQNESQETYRREQDGVRVQKKSIKHINKDTFILTTKKNNIYILVFKNNMILNMYVLYYIHVDSVVFIFIQLQCGTTEKYCASHVHSK